jgi:hypothetical protein
MPDFHRRASVGRISDRLFDKRLPQRSNLRLGRIYPMQGCEKASPDNVVSADAVQDMRKNVPDG